MTEKESKKKTKKKITRKRRKQRTFGRKERKRCSTLDNNQWIQLLEYFDAIWKNRLIENPLLYVCFRKQQNRIGKCQDLSEEQWSQFKTDMKRIRIKRKVQIIGQQEQIENARRLASDHSKLAKLREDPLDNLPEEMRSIIEFWNSRPYVSRLQIRRNGKKQARIFYQTIQTLRKFLLSHSETKTIEAIQVYSDFLGLMKKKCPHIFRQMGLRVPLIDFLLVRPSIRNRISSNAPHKDVASWFSLCKRSTPQSLYLRFSFVGRFDIKPEHEEIFSLFLGYYWKWLILPDKPKKIQDKAAEVFSNLQRSVLELFEDSTIDLAEDFNFLVITRINSAFQNYITYISRNNPELLEVSNGNAERGVRAIFKSLPSVKQTVPTFYPTDFVKNRTYQKFERLIADEESALAIRFYSSSNVQKKLKSKVKSNSSKAIREARRKLLDEIQQIQMRVSKGLMSSEQATKEIEEIQIKLRDPLALQQKTNDVQTRLQRRLNFERKVLRRRKKKNRKRILDMQKKLKDQKKQEQQEHKLNQKHIDQLRTERMTRDKLIIASIPRLGYAHALLDSKPNEADTNPFLINESEEFNLELTFDLSTADSLVWEHEVYETFQLKEPWYNDYSWNFYNLESNEVIKLKSRLSDREVNEVRIPKRLGPPIDLRVWTCPNGLLFVDGSPIIRNGKDLQKLTDFEKGIMRKPSMYIDWSNTNVVTFDDVSKSKQDNLQLPDMSYILSTQQSLETHQFSQS